MNGLSPSDKSKTNIYAATQKDASTQCSGNSDVGGYRAGDKFRNLRHASTTNKFTVPTPQQIDSVRPLKISKKRKCTYIAIGALAVLSVMYCPASIPAGISAGLGIAVTLGICKRKDVEPIIKNTYRTCMQWLGDLRTKQKNTATTEV